MTDTLRSRGRNTPTKSTGTSRRDFKYGRNKDSNTRLQFVETLLVALLPPLLILVAFGGKPTFLTLGLGATVAYILDLLGTVEGTFGSIVIIAIAFWVSLLWAGRLLLYDSLLNFFMVISFGFYLFLLLLALAFQFRTLRDEFYQTVFFWEYFLFAVTPIVSSPILAWFLYVEIPTFELPTAFSLIYFCYLLFLLKPRSTSFPLSNNFKKDIKNQHLCYILKLSVVKVLYIVPIIISPLLTIIIKRNYIFSLSWSSLTSFAISFLFPMLLMIVCVENQINYWPIEQQKDVLMYISTVKLFVSALLFACVQDNPIFDDLKAFSKLSDVLASATFGGVFMLVTLSIIIYRSDAIINGTLESTEKDRLNSTTTPFLIKRIMVDICTGCAGLLMGLLLRLPFAACPIAIVGPVALAEYYQSINNAKAQLQIVSKKLDLDIDYSSGNASTATEFRVTNLALALLAAISSSAIILSYALETMYFYTFVFDLYGYKFSLKILSYVSTIMTGVSIFVPMVIYDAKVVTLISENNDSKSSSDRGILPTVMSHVNQFSTGVYKARNQLLEFIECYVTTKNTFGIVFPFTCTVFAVIEFVILEQDWSLYGITSESVYPHQIFIGTALMISATATHLFNKEAIQLWSLFTVLLVQLLKLSHLTGLKLLDVLAVGALILAYTRPFLVHCFDNTSSNNSSKSSSSNRDSHEVNDGGEHTSDKTTSAASNAYGNLHSLLLVIYIGNAAFATNFARTTGVASRFLLALTWRESDDTQHAMACLCIFSAFTATILYVFRRNMKLVRSIFVGLTILCALLTSDIFSFSIGFSKSFPFIQFSLFNRDNYLIADTEATATQSHSTLFFGLTCLLIISATTSAFSIKRPIGRVVYCLIFSFTASRTVLGWYFTDQNNKPYNWLSLPSQYTFLFVFLCTATSLLLTYVNRTKSISSTSTSNVTSSLPLTSTIAIVLFLLVLFLPNIYLLFSIVTMGFSEMVAEHAHAGIIWTAALGHGMLGLSIRFSDILNRIHNIKSLNRVSGDQAVSIVFGTDDVTSDSSNKTIDGSSADFISLITSCAAVVWTIIITQIAPPTTSYFMHVLVPFSSLYLLAIPRSFLVHNYIDNPMGPSIVMSALWWVACGLYSVFVKVDDSSDPFASTYSIFSDGSVSIWSTEGSKLLTFMPFIHFVLIFAPLPSIFLSVLLKNKNQSEELSFILSVISCASVIGSQLNSVRWLGLLGAVVGFWRTHAIGIKHKQGGHRLI